jgi:hypothetical protein
MITCRECGQRNASGTTFCENRACGAFLRWSTAVSSRPLASPSAAHRPGWGTGNQGRRRLGNTWLSARLGRHELSVAPGATVETNVNVRNNGCPTDRYDIRLLGEATLWATVDPPALDLAPGAEGTARLIFRPPRQPDLAAGPHTFRLVAASRQHPHATAAAEGTVEVAPFHEVETWLRPQVVEGRRGSFDIGLANDGNVAVTTRVEADDPTGALALRVSHPVVSVPAGGRGMVTVHARHHRRALWGAPRALPFRVVAHSGGAPPHTMDAELVYRPLIPPLGRCWMAVLRVVLTLAGAALMIAGAFADWLPGVDGVDLTYNAFADTAFPADAPARPTSVDATFASVGLAPIGFGVVALVGMASRSRVPTRLAAGITLLLVAAFAVTVIDADLSLGLGVYVVAAGTTLALAGSSWPLAPRR